MPWNLAELNIAKMMYAPDGPEMQDFNDALDSVNALADGSEGFVWRLVSDPDDAHAELVFGDGSWLVNLSVWCGVDDLMAFVRTDLHLSVMRRRSEWFAPQAEATMVLWWIPEGHVPTVQEARERLLALRADGPSQSAFGFSETWPPPAGEP